MKYESWDVLEYLIKRGAYYIGLNGHMNNLEQEAPKVYYAKNYMGAERKQIKENYVYKISHLGKSDFSEDMLKSIKDFFKWVRFKPFLHALHFEEEKNKLTGKMSAKS